MLQAHDVSEAPPAVPEAMRRAHDPDWLEAQYNNRARIPDHAAIFSRWRAASDLVRAQVPVGVDVAYGRSAGDRLDLYLTDRPKAPVLVFLHGGYWRSLDKADHAFIAPVFTQAGAMVVVPNYDLCPTVGLDDIAVQVARALAWTWRHALEYGGDPSRIVLAGHSAGGHLAAMMLSCRWKQVGDDLPAQLVSSALSISGLYDLEPLRHAPFLQRDLRLTPQLVARLSPAFFPRPKGKLLALVGGDETEEFRRQNQLIRDQWGPTSVPVCESVPGTHHLSVLHELVDPASRMHALARRLLGL